MPDPIRADKVAAAPVEWLWRELIPRGMLTTVGGRADQGKGLLMAFLAAYVSRTRYPCFDKQGVRIDGKQRWGQVLYSAIEDDHGRMTRPRLEAAGANLSNVDLWRFRLPIMFDELEQHLRSKPHDLVILDPMASHLSNGISRHSDNIRKVTDPLTRLIEETNTACIIVEHVLKRVPQSGHPLAAIGGSSSGIVAASRMAFLFGLDPGDSDRRYLACVKNNIRERPKEVAFELDVIDHDIVGEVPALVFDDECTFDPMRMLQVDRVNGNRGVGRPPDKRAAACEWLTNYLYSAGEPVPAGKLLEDCKHYGFTTKTMKAAANDMEVVRSAKGGPKVTWWLPDALLEELNQAFGVDTRCDLSADVSTEVSDEELKKLLGEAGDGK